MSVCLQTNQSESRREERGCDLAGPWLLRNSRFTFQFNMALPRSPHACLCACQADWRHGATGQKQLLHKDTPSNYFQWQHTILWPLQRVKLHMTVTLHHCGGTTPTARKIASNNTDSYHKERNRNSKFKCACTETPVDAWMCLSLISFLIPRLAALLKATNTQVNKARRKHGGSRFRWLRAFQEKIFPVSSTELMNFH